MSMPRSMRRAARCWLAAILALTLSSQSRAETVLCRHTYGGETGVVEATPVTLPYAVPAVAVGSYFLFRVVLQTSPSELAAVKVYVYADREGGPVPVHQGTYPYPPAQHPGTAFGFTGLHHVYEPVRDGELQYWCGMASGAGGEQGAARR